MPAAVGRASGTAPRHQQATKRLEHHGAQAVATRQTETSWPARSRFARGTGVADGAAKTPESDDHENRDRHDKGLTVAQHAEEFAPSRHTPPAAKQDLQQAAAQS
jgi:hypothetical protein